MQIKNVKNNNISIILCKSTMFKITIFYDNFIEDMSQTLIKRINNFQYIYFL